jgi:hypothetical protein
LKDDPEADEKQGIFEVNNKGQKEPIVKPSKVYRLFVNLHRKSKEYGEESVLGRVSTPYYVATSGETRLDQARRHVAMRTFKEFYYTEKRWRSKESYPMDCYAFYVWATGSCTVGARSGRANLARLFSGNTPFRNGSHISGIAEKESIHGDYVRKPGHSFMLLAYDRKLKRVWTMEGNFGRSIEVAVRPTNSEWKVGHLAEEHIRADLFDTAATPRDASSPTASVETRDAPTS